jgi:hypothetical protein
MFHTSILLESLKDCDAFSFGTGEREGTKVEGRIEVSVDIARGSFARSRSQSSRIANEIKASSPLASTWALLESEIESASEYVSLMVEYDMVTGRKSTPVRRNRDHARKGS